MTDRQQRQRKMDARHRLEWAVCRLQRHRLYNRARAQAVKTAVVKWLAAHPPQPKRGKTT